LDNSEKLVTYGIQDDKKQSKAQHNMYWTPVSANKHETRN